MLLKNKITIEANNDGVDNNTVSISSQVDTNFLEIMTTLEIAQRDLKRDLLSYLENNPEKQENYKTITFREVYGK